MSNLRGIRLAMSEFSREQLWEMRGYIERALHKVRSCYNCQPAGAGPDDMWIGGVPSNMTELLAYDLEIPEEYWEEITSFIDCPRCGTPLDTGSEIGVTSLIEDKIESMWFEWKERYSNRLGEFFDFLEKYPYLGITHDIGAEIYATVASFPQRDIERRTGFKGRAGTARVKSPKDMYPPDPAAVKIPEGRFNHFGQRVFYLANSEEGAAKEGLEEPGKVWLQKFRIENATKILDLTVDPAEEPEARKNLLTFGLIYGGELRTFVEREKGWKPEYFVPRFIADCARKEGFNGIKYKSSRYYLENLVLFSWEEESITPLGNPYKYSLAAEYFAESTSEVGSPLDVFDEKYEEILAPVVEPSLPGM